MSRSLPCHSLVGRALPCRALPCRALPCRALPSRAITLIREYSRPLTLPDWRTIQRLTTFDLYSHVYCHLRTQTPLMQRIYYNILDTQWYNIYTTIKLSGIYIAAERYKMTTQEILRIKGMSGAVTYHSFWGDEQ